MDSFNIKEIVESEQLKTQSIRPDINLKLVEFVVMPNHFHAIFNIDAKEYNNSKITNRQT